MLNDEERGYVRTLENRYKYLKNETAYGKPKGETWNYLRAEMVAIRWALQVIYHADQKEYKKVSYVKRAKGGVKQVMIDP